MVKSIFILFIAILSLDANAQIAIDPNTQIEIKVNGYNQAFYEHTIQKDETLFSLAKFFKIPLNDLLLINKMRQGDTVPLGATVMVPIDTEEMQTATSKKSDNWIPLIYTVKRQETLYKISSTLYNVSCLLTV